MHTFLPFKQEASDVQLASACVLILYNGGRSRGQTPRTPNTFYTNTTNPMTIDTVTRVNTSLVNHHQMKICHIIKMPHQQDGTALHVAVRTVRTGTVSTQIFTCLTWRSNRDISSIRTPFAKINIPPESGKRDGRNGTVFVSI
jgi:hypothetical protein